MLGLITHNAEIPEIDSNIVSLFLDFLVKQISKKLWFCVRNLSVFNVEYFYTIAFYYSSVFGVPKVINFFIVTSLILGYALSDIFNTISVSRSKTMKKGVASMYQSIGCIN